MAVAAACFTFATQARAAEAPLSGEADTSDEIVVIGSGQTRSVSTLTPSNLDVLPPGTSVQKALNFLPGVMAQSIDALGLNEQSLSLQVRGFSTTHLGYTLDGMPLGDGAYNINNGLTISSALISDNLGRADLATGIAGLSIPSTSNLGGAVLYTSSNPKKNFGVLGQPGLRQRRQHAQLPCASIPASTAAFSAYISGQYSEQYLFVGQDAYNTSYGKQLNAKAQYEFERGKVTAFADLSRTNQADDAYISKDILNRLGWDWAAMRRTGRPISASPPAPLPRQLLVPPRPAPQKNLDVTFTNGPNSAR
ncbi:MAG: TonB-dependent receptor plug domain-containing protein [Alphaproteobacteria bacterium]